MGGRFTKRWRHSRYPQSYTRARAYIYCLTYGRSTRTREAPHGESGGGGCARVSRFDIYHVERWEAVLWKERSGGRAAAAELVEEVEGGRTTQRAYERCQGGEAGCEFLHLPLISVLFSPGADADGVWDYGGRVLLHPEPRLGGAG